MEQPLPIFFLRRRAQAMKSDRPSATADEFLSIVKKKFDRRKDRVKTLSVDDFQ
jgi:hypothetical protein